VTRFPPASGRFWRLLSSIGGLCAIVATVAAASPGPVNPTVLWSADMETGDLTQWYAPATSEGNLNGGGLYNSGSFEATVTAEHARTGTYSLEAAITSPPTSGIRAFRWLEARTHQNAYFSVWLYVPTRYQLTGNPHVGRFWSLFQFKSRSADGHIDPLWAFYVKQSRAGPYLVAGWGWGGTTAAGPYPTSTVGGKWFQPARKLVLPVRRWVHLEAFLGQSKDFAGRLVFWQDGTRLFDLEGVRTSYENCTYNAWCADNEWSVNNYSDGLSPTPSTIYIDDATIATQYVR
jgi:hypothetical protein